MKYSANWQVVLFTTKVHLLTLAACQMLILDPELKYKAGDIPEVPSESSRRWHSTITEQPLGASSPTLSS